MYPKIAPIFLASTLFLIMFASIVPVAHSIDWSPDMRLTWKVRPHKHPSITQTSDGKIWFVWSTQITGNYELFYKVYDKTLIHPWSSETQLTNNASDDLTPSIMQAMDGTIWVVWASNRTGNSDIYYKTYSSSWSPDKPLILHPSFDISPSITQLGNGTIWVVWCSNRIEEDWEIFYTASSDNGATWTLPKRITSIMDLGFSDTDPAVMQAANGTIWVVWAHEYDIYYKTNKGTSWSSEYRLTTDYPPKHSVCPSIMQAQNEDIWIAWDSDRAQSAYADIYNRIYINSTKSWSPADTQLTTDPEEDLDPSILQAADGTIWVAWYSTRQDSVDLYYRTNTVPPQKDVSIFSVETSQTTVVQGINTIIEVVSQNKGTQSQTFNVKCYADPIPTGTPILIGTKSVSVDAGQLNVSQFQWDATGVTLGAYAVRAEAILTDDAVPSDNAYTDGTITVVKHDVAIKSVTPSETIAQEGYRLHVDVVVKNEGNFTESVTVTVYRDGTGIGTQGWSGLAQSAEVTLVFDWIPTSPYRNYIIKATVANVEDEFYPNLDNNSKTDGTVTVTIPGDINGDHNVNTSDLLLLSSHWHSENYDSNIDIQNDEIIDVFDIFILSTHFNQNW